MNRPDNKTPFDKDLQSILSQHEFDFDPAAHDQFIEKYGNEAIRPENTFLRNFRNYLPLMILLFMVILGLSLWVKQALNAAYDHPSQSKETIEKLHFADTQKSDNTNEPIIIDTKTLQSSSEVQPEYAKNNSPQEKTVAGFKTTLDNTKANSQIKNAIIQEEQAPSIPTIANYVPVSNSTTGTSILEQEESRSMAIEANIERTVSAAKAIHRLPRKRSANKPLQVSAIPTLAFASLNVTEENNFPTLSSDKYFVYDKTDMRSKWNFGITGSYGWNETNLAFNGADEIQNTAKLAEASFVSNEGTDFGNQWQLGLRAFYSLTENISLRSGLSFLRQNYSNTRRVLPTSEMAEINEPLFTQSESYLQTSTLSQNKLMLPIGIQRTLYSNNKNFALYAGAMLQYTLQLNLMAQSADAFPDPQGANADGTEASYQTTLPEKSGFQYGAFAGIALGNLKGTHLLLEPQLIYNKLDYISPADNSTISSIWEPALSVHLRF